MLYFFIVCGMPTRLYVIYNVLVQIYRYSTCRLLSRYTSWLFPVMILNHGCNILYIVVYLLLPQNVFFYLKYSTVLFCHRINAVCMHVNQSFSWNPVFVQSNQVLSMFCYYFNVLSYSQTLSQYDLLLLIFDITHCKSMLFLIFFSHNLIIIRSIL